MRVLRSTGPAIPLSDDRALRRPLGWVALLALAALTGCSGPQLVVTSSAPAKIYFRATHDPQGTELPADGAYTALGDAAPEEPVEWELPPSLYGARAHVKAVYPTGERGQYIRIAIRTEDSEDQRISFSPPVGLSP